MLALWDAAIQTFQQVLRSLQIRIEFQYPQDIIACTIDLSGSAQGPSDIHSNGALARGALERLIPEPDGFTEVSTAGFGHFGMSNVPTQGRSPVAGGAVGFVRVMPGRKLVALTRQTLLPIIRSAFRGGRFVVGIVTAGAGHGVAGLLLAHAFRQCLKLTDGSETRLLIVCKYKVVDVVGEPLPGKLRMSRPGCSIATFPSR